MKQKHVALSFGLAAITAMCLAVIVPLQSYLCNKSLYDFSLQEFLVESFVIALGITIFCGVILLASEFLTGRLLHVLCVAFLVYEYLEIGFFSMSLPPIDGKLVSGCDPFLKYVDIGVLLLLVGLGVLLCRYVKNFLHWIALGVLLLMTASLFDVRREKSTKTSGMLAECACEKYDVAKNVRYSSKKNLFLIIIDATPSDITTDILLEQNELQKSYCGFTAYTNTVGMSDLTIRGLPGLLTGKYYEPGMSEQEYVDTCLGDDSFLMPWCSSNKPFYFVPGCFKVGFTNRRARSFMDNSTVARSRSVFLRQTIDIPYPTLFDVMCYRMVPHHFKKKVITKILRYSSDSRYDVYGEAPLYRILKEADLSEEPVAIHVYHTRGLHPPAVIDRNGKALATFSEERSAFHEVGIYVLRQLASLMDALREKGVYDSSTIVVTADHGSWVLDKSSELRGTDSVLLWVKPPQARAPWHLDGTPVSSSRVAPLMRRAMDCDLTQDEISQILYQKERLYRPLLPKPDYYVDFIFDENRKIISRTRRGRF